MMNILSAFAKIALSWCVGVSVSLLVVPAAVIALLIYFQILYIHSGRYSPVRRASEGSRCQMLSHGPFQECQQLQKGLAHKNLLVTQSPPLDCNTTSLPGEGGSTGWPPPNALLKIM